MTPDIDWPDFVAAQTREQLLISTPNVIRQDLLIQIIDDAIYQRNNMKKTIMVKEVVRALYPLQKVSLETQGRYLVVMLGSDRDFIASCIAVYEKSKPWHASWRAVSQTIGRTCSELKNDRIRRSILLGPGEDLDLDAGPATVPISDAEDR